MDLAEHYRASLTSAKLLQDPELFLTDPRGFALRKASPLQRAIAWLIGTGEIPDRLWAVDDVRTAFGNARPEKSWEVDEMGILAGIRGGKTLMAAMAVTWATQHVNLDEGPGEHMVRGEIPRVSIVSVSKDQAETAFRYIKGAVEGSPALSQLMVGKPTADTITMRHPSGRPIEICVVAGSAAGSSLVGRWCAGVIFDEAPMMALGEGGVINLKDMATSVRLRMLKGAKILYIGSPWGNSGFIYDLFHQNYGREKPTALFIRAQGWMLNPNEWTPEKMEYAKRKDERAYRLNCLAEFMDPESAMYSSFSVDQAMAGRGVIKPPEDGKTYTASIDPGFSSNSWTFGIAETQDNVRYDVVYAQQWTGSGQSPLVAGDVFDEMLPTLHVYRCAGSVKTDQYAAAPLVEIALTRGIGLSPLTITKANKFKLYSSVGVRLDSGYLSLPPLPEMRQDLLNVKKRITTDGVKVVLPETADGRHCDYAAMLALLVGDYLQSSAEVAKQAKAAAAEDDDDVDWTPREEEEEYDNRDYDA